MLNIFQDLLYCLLFFQRLKQIGAIITTSEAILFQLIADKGHAKFKEVQSLIKDVAPQPGLIPGIHCPE